MVSYGFRIDLRHACCEAMCFVQYHQLYATSNVIFHALVGSCCANQEHLATDSNGFCFLPEGIEGSGFWAVEGGRIMIPFLNSQPIW